MREALVRFQPTQGQLGSNRDATIKLSPSAPPTPFGSPPSLLGFQVPPLPGGVVWEGERLAVGFN